MYQFYQTHCMHDITATICMTSYALHMTHHIDSSGHHTTLYMLQVHYIWPHIQCIWVITPNLSVISETIYMTSHPVYLWYRIQYIYDIISSKYYITKLFVDDTTLGICMTSFALQMISHPLFHIKPQNLWGHIHFRHDITAPVSDITPTVYLSSQPLHWYHTHYCMTTHLPSVWDYIH